jgi:hypothetical protein
MKIIDIIFRKKKEIKEPERNPYWGYDRVILNKDIEHQGIGGKTAYIEREVTIDDILERVLNYNIAALNFAKRRPDLFRDFEDMNIPDNKLVKRKARYKNMKYYYVKVLNNPEHLNGCHTYLGYFIASDEYTDYIKAKDVKEEPIWI